MCNRLIAPMQSAFVVPGHNLPIRLRELFKADEGKWSDVALEITIEGANLKARQTNEPTDQPTNQPTNQPSDRPTDRPTNQPTNQPTVQPTNRPTNRPTDQPATS